MGPITRPGSKPHVILIPYPAQGHITPLLKFGKLLHHKGFFITFVNTDFNHRRLLRSGALSDFESLPDLRFTSIPDGLPESDADATQHIPSLCYSTTNNCLEPFCQLIEKLNGCEDPPVTCIISDAVMSFTLKAAERFRLPEIMFWTASTCGLLGYSQYRTLIEKGYVPLEDMRQLTNDYMETTIDWIPGKSNMRLRDIPSFIRTTDPNDIMLNFFVQEIDALHKCKALIINTFDALEQDALDIVSVMVPRIYTIGPLHMMMNHVDDQRLDALKSNLWKEDSGCIEWLDTKEPESVVFVNFGSITVMTPEQFTEFAWGLANSKKSFLWIVRPDIVAGDSAMLPSEFLVETKDRSMMINWCPQEQVLKHPSIGVFLTHSGWNSTIESISNGVPVICWPFFAEQQTNCRYSCVEWGIGMEIDNNVKRDVVESLVQELMDGEKGKKMKANAMDWKRKAQEATAKTGPSYLNMERLVDELLL